MKVVNFYHISISSGHLDFAAEPLGFAHSDYQTIRRILVDQADFILELLDIEAEL